MKKMLQEKILEIILAYKLFILSAAVSYRPLFGILIYMYLPYYICIIVSWSIQSLNSLLFTENVLIPHKHDSTVKDHWWDASHISLVLLYKSKTFELSRGPDLLPPPPPSNRSTHVPDKQNLKKPK